MQARKVSALCVNAKWVDETDETFQLFVLMPQIGIEASLGFSSSADSD